MIHSIELLALTCQDSLPLPQQVPYGLDPYTPNQEQLIPVCKFDNGELIKIEGLYFHNGKLFNGWTSQEAKNNDHKFRYIKYDQGLIVWQIGFYANGKLDLDFHGFNGKNRGSQRMWRMDGSPYIDTFFLAGNVQHGLQRRWHAGNIIAMESKYEQGILIYKRTYDQFGHLILNK